MKFFEANGLWFPADDPDNAVGGTLRFSPDGLRLSLLGSFLTAWTARVQEYPVIHGVVGSNPYGHYATIFDGLRASSTIDTPGITSEIITASRAILGDEHLESENRAFDSAYVEYTYLLEWFGRRALRSRPSDRLEETFVIRYSKPILLEAPIPGGILKLGYSATTHQDVRSAKIDLRAEVVFEPRRQISSIEFSGNYIKRFQDLLSFATNTPNGVEKVEFFGDFDERFDLKIRKKFGFIYDAIFRVEERKAHLFPQDMLFTFKDSQEADIDIFGSWFDFTTKHAAFCTVYFAALYREPPYLDQKFSRLMSAFTLLCTSMLGTTDRTEGFLGELESLASSHFAEQDLGLLQHVLPTGGEVEMPFRMLELLERHSGIMKQVIPDDFRSFVRSITDTLAFVERRQAPNNRPHLQGTEMLHSIDRVRWLVKVIILSELGFPCDKIASLVESNKYFNHLKTIS